MPRLSLILLLSLIWLLSALSQAKAEAFGTWKWGREFSRGENVAAGSCTAPVAAGPINGCVPGSGWLEFRFPERLVDGNYAIEVWYASKTASWVDVTAGSSGHTTGRYLPSTSGLSQFQPAKFAVYRMKGAGQTVRISSRTSLPAIQQVAISGVGPIQFKVDAGSFATGKDVGIGSCGASPGFMANSNDGQCASRPNSATWRIDFSYTGRYKVSTHYANAQRVRHEAEGNPIGLRLDGILQDRWIAESTGGWTKEHAKFADIGQIDVSNPGPSEFNLSRAVPFPHIHSLTFLRLGPIPQPPTVVAQPSPPATGNSPPIGSPVRNVFICDNGRWDDSDALCRWTNVHVCSNADRPSTVRVSYLVAGDPRNTATPFDRVTVSVLVPPRAKIGSGAPKMPVPSHWRPLIGGGGLGTPATPGSCMSRDFRIESIQ